MATDDRQSGCYNPAKCEHRPNVQGSTLAKFKTRDGIEWRCLNCHGIRHITPDAIPDRWPKLEAYRQLRTAWHARAWR